MDHGSRVPEKLNTEIRTAFAALSAGNPDMAVAVRSSATAEDLPDASFAGQQETFLNIRGVENVIRAAKSVRLAVQRPRHSYRVHQGFDHKLVALSAGVQRMVRSETGTAGVMFTLDTESGFRTWCSSPAPTAWAKPWCRARSTRTSSTCTSHAGGRSPGDPAPQPGQQG
jgi:phosphoenolpyruvate synthase/pyruvate phosphate dikinase